MDNQSACEMVSAAATTSDFKKSFICASDQLHHGLTQSPLAIFAYVFGVLLVMAIVHRASKPLRGKAPKATDR